MSKFKNVYFINGTAYAGKSTMLKMLSEKYNGYLCEENYHNLMLQEINSCEFPALTYTRDLKDWRKFIRRTPDEYEAWIKEVTKECTILELQILEKLAKENNIATFITTQKDETKIASLIEKINGYSFNVLELETRIDEV